jgi:acyl-CoA reductase-like NAD-dependent aldehyde dehydrogenase
MVTRTKPAADPARTIDVYNPITDQVIDRIADSTPGQVAAAVAEARAAQPAWEAMGVEQRAYLLRRWAGG